MNTIPVKMLAFGEPNEVRMVDVPNLTGDVNKDLELVFQYGQNDFQNKPHPSVSVGDVIIYDNSHYLVLPLGFRKMDEDEIKTYEMLHQRDRVFMVYEQVIGI